MVSYHELSFPPGGSEIKASACNAGDLGSIRGLGRSLEKEMATHSSILAWRILWTEEPVSLQSMELQRHDLANKHMYTINLLVCPKVFTTIYFGDWYIEKVRDS